MIFRDSEDSTRDLQSPPPCATDPLHAPIRTALSFLCPPDLRPAWGLGAINSMAWSVLEAAARYSNCTDPDRLLLSLEFDDEVRLVEGAYKLCQHWKIEGLIGKVSVPDASLGTSKRQLLKGHPWILLECQLNVLNFTRISLVQKLDV